MNVGRNSIFAILIAIAFSIGFLLPSPLNRHLRTSKELSPLSPAILKSELSAYKNSNFQPKDQPKESESPALAEVGDINSEVSSDKILRNFLLSEFKKSGGWIRLNVFDGEGNLTESFAELYGLTAFEIEEIQKEANKVRENHFRLAKANSELTTLEDGTSRVILNPFESPENIYSNMLDSFQRVMGDERFSDFLDLGEREMRDKFHQFGAEEMIVEVTPKTEKVESEDGQLVEVTKYDIVETKVSANGKTSRSLNGTGEDYFSNEFPLIKRIIDEEDSNP